MFILLSMIYRASLRQHTATTANQLQETSLKLNRHISWLLSRNDCMPIKFAAGGMFMKTMRALLRLATITLIISACAPDRQNLAQMEMAKRQAMELAAKLGDSPDTKLATRSAIAGLPTNTGEFWVFFLTVDDRVSYPMRLGGLGTVSSVRENVSTSVDALSELSKTGTLTRQGDFLHPTLYWKVAELPDVYFFLYETSTLTQTTYEFNGKVITRNVAAVLATYQLTSTQSFK
jgi:hypothetical protein